MFKDNLNESLYFKSLMDADLPVSFYWMDKDGVVLGCNEGQAHMFGFPSSKEFIGQSVYSLSELFGWSEEMCEAVRKNDLTVMDTGKAIVTEEVFEINGKNRTYLSHKSPFLDSKGEIMGVFGFSYDITERKEAEAALKAAKEAAEIANLNKSEFVENMSQDLRVLLEGIMSMADQIDRVSSEKITQECAHDIHQSGNELLGLLNKFVATLKTELGHSVLVKKYQVLLFENSLLSRKVVEHLLKQEGFEVVVAQTSTELLEQIKHQTFDLILIDVGLPKECDEMVKTIRQDHPDLYIIGLITQNDLEAKAKCLAMGMQDVINKPLNAEKIKTFAAKINPKIDLAPIAQIMGGNIDLAQEMLDMLMQELPKFKEDIKVAYDQQDWETLKHHVHKLHGGLCYVGALQLKDVTCHFEKQLMDKTGHYEQAYAAFLKEMDKAITAYRG